MFANSKQVVNIKINKKNKNIFKKVLDNLFTICEHVFVSFKKLKKTENINMKRNNKNVIRTSNKRFNRNNARG